MGKLQSAKDSRKYQEYQASVTEDQRIEQMNQARLHYQQQLAQYEQRLADREFQVSQLQARLNDVSNQIASLSVLKAPYAGTVRRISWLGQSPDGSLTAEVTLMVGNSEQSSVISQEEPITELPCLDNNNQCVNELTETRDRHVFKTPKTLRTYNHYRRTVKGNW